MDERHAKGAETGWMQRGLCRQVPPSTFFPNDGVGVEVARRICEACPVQAPCLHGVWGGASERERRRILKRRRQSARADAEAPPASPRG